jgi:hypothetical protein
VKPEKEEEEEEDLVGPYKILWVRLLLPYPAD